MCIHDGFYDSACSALLQPINYSSSRYRLSEQPGPMSTPSLTSSGSDTSMESVGLLSIAEDIPSSLCLTQWLGKGAVGDGWKGVFLPVSKPGAVLDIVAKVGRHKDACQLLIEEARIYKLLQKQDVDGVPVVIGLFNDVDDQVPILVTTYAGEQIRRLDESLK